MNPGTTGVVPAARSGRSARRARRAGLGKVRRGAAVLCVRRHDLSGVHVFAPGVRLSTARRPAGRPTCARRARPACRWRAAGCVRARRWRRSSSRYSRAAASIVRAARAGPRPPAAARARSRGAVAAALQRPRAPRSACRPRQDAHPPGLIGDTGQRRRDDDERPGMLGDEAGGALNRARIGQRCAAELPDFADLATLAGALTAAVPSLPHRLVDDQFIDRPTHRVVAVGQFHRRIGDSAASRRRAACV